MFKKAVSLILLIVVACGFMAMFAGCGSVAEDSRNISSRPWNTPKTWEGPLPSTINEGR